MRYFIDSLSLYVFSRLRDHPTIEGLQKLKTRFLWMWIKVRDQSRLWANQIAEAPWRWIRRVYQITFSAN
jgi:hypothetical protein